MAIVQLNIKQRVGSVECLNTFHIQSIRDVEQDAEEAISELHSAWNTHLRFQLGNTWTLYGASYRDLSSAGLPTFDVSLTALVGQDSGEQLPRGTSGLVWFKANAAPPNRARKYIPGFTESANAAGGQPSGAIVTALSDFAQTLITHNTSGNFTDWYFCATRIDRPGGTAFVNNMLLVAGSRDYWGMQRSRRE